MLQSPRLLLRRFLPSDVQAFYLLNSLPAVVQYTARPALAPYWIMCFRSYSYRLLQPLCIGRTRHLCKCRKKLGFCQRALEQDNINPYVLARGFTEQRQTSSALIYLVRQARQE